MKKCFAILLVLLLLFPVTALAAGGYVYDHNNHLTASQLEQLNSLAAGTYDTYGFDILIDMDDSVTEDAVDYAARRYAEIGGAPDGILLVITAGHWYIHLVGGAEAVFGEEYINYLWNAYDIETTYFDGVAEYLAAADVMLELYYDVPAAAEPDTPAIPEERQLARLVDDAGLLTDTERGELRKLLDEISERQKCDVAVVTVNSLGGKSSEAFADDFYDYNGYGMGSGDDGILLLLSMEERDWAISTYGFAIPAFTDAGQEYMVGKFRSDLGAGEYASAFETFATLCDEFLTQAKTGEPYDKGHLPNTVGFLPFLGGAFVFFLPLGFVVAMIITGIMKKSLTSVMLQGAARNYVRKESVSISGKHDHYLYKTVSKTARASESSSGGGSSTRTSSSGRSHGGSSGKF